MKLQTNLNGAWRDVIEFKPERLREVQSAAYGLALTTAKPRFRIDRGAKEALYLEPCNGSWHTLKTARTA